MNKNQIFDKHYKRLVKEGIIRSVISGFAIFFGTSFALAFLYWMLAFGSILLSVVTGILIGAASGTLLYFLRYKPSVKAAARRVDRLGLEERMITMLEFSRDDSYIAELQRKDAKEKLSGVSAKRIRYTLSKLSVFAVMITLIFTASAVTLGALADADKIPYGKEMLFGVSVGEYEVVYTAAEGGTLIGEASQTVKQGEDTSRVRAVADDGWVFARWDDGGRSPERYESGVERNITLTAIFEKIDKNDSAANDEDFADDTPSGSKEESGGGSDGDDGDDTAQGNDGQGGGKWEDKNKFIDGATYYKDYLELFRQYAMGIFETDKDIPPELIEFFETYYSGI